MNARAIVANAVAAAAHRLGIEVMRLESPRHPVARRIRLMRSLAIDLVIDVGANEGQYARELRAFGYHGRIVSVEALEAPFRVLQSAAARDERWRVIHSAVGARDCEADMYVAANHGASSSLLPMLALHESNAPEARIVATERVRVRRLDDLIVTDITRSREPFLKMDVQGFEAEVLEGARAILPRLAGIQVELQLFELYEGAPTLAQMLDALSRDGFVLAGVEPGLVGRDGRLLDADGLFIRRPVAHPPSNLSNH